MPEPEKEFPVPPHLASEYLAALLRCLCIAQGVLPADLPPVPVAPVEVRTVDDSDLDRLQDILKEHPDYVELVTEGKLVL